MSAGFLVEQEQSFDGVIFYSMNSVMNEWVLPVIVSRNDFWGHEMWRPNSPGFYALLSRLFWESYGQPKAPELHRCGILFRGKEDTARLDVTMNNVILMTVTQGFQKLTHVVTRHGFTIGITSFNTRYNLEAQVHSFQATEFIQFLSEFHSILRKFVLTIQILSREAHPMNRFQGVQLYEDAWAYDM